MIVIVYIFKIFSLYEKLAMFYDLRKKYNLTFLSLLGG